jgi:2-hydroxychromene-2-carboxylate isomerase
MEPIMSNTITFYFDFSSPFGFLASQHVGALAASIGRQVIWRPFLIGAVYKEFGGAPIEHPLKKNYVLKDFMRSARLAGIAEAKVPANFPASPVAPSRVLYWIEREAPDRVGDFAENAFRSYWLDGHDVSDATVAVDAAVKLGFEPAAVKSGMQEQEIKERLRAATEEAIAGGVFGSPFIKIDDELFWGFDRFDHIRKLYSRREGN